MDQLQHVGRPTVGGIVHREGGIEFKSLRQVADDQIAPTDDLPAVGGIATGEEAQEGGLAGAIAPDESDPVPGGDREGRIFQEDAIMVPEFQIPRREQSIFSRHRGGG